MTKALILTAALAITGLGAANAQSYTIRGTAPTSENGKTVYMTEYEQNKTLDSAVVKDGKFTFNRNDKGFRRLDLGRSYANFIAEPGTITVDISNPKLVGGTPLNDSVAMQMDRQQKLYEEADKMLADSTLTMDEKRERGTAAMAQYKNAVLASYKANKNNLFGAVALWDISYNMGPDEYIALYKEGGEAVRDFGPLMKIKKSKEAVAATGAGKPFVDFEGVDSTGRAVKLSDYVGKGKYVLVDFWASWCGPCRQETPVVAKAYEKYKDKGLDVLGLFVWDREKNLGKAVKELNITWPQLIDSNDVVRDMYGVQGIPHIMLIGPDGTILARGLRGDGIEQEIAKHIQ